MHISSNISRRDFIKKAGLTLSALTFVPGLMGSCSKPSVITGSFVDDHSKLGHLMRDGFKGKPVKTVHIPLAIIGAGISGLSAAWYLTKHSKKEFLVFDLSETHGGNSVSGANTVSSYPWAAHYLPIVNNSNTELIDFLHEHQVITGFDTKGLPVYDEYYLCFDPEERLFINGYWQNGLVPSFGVPEAEKQEIARFFKLVHDYKHRIGSDQKPVFEIPLSAASTDQEFKNLDKISFIDFLKQQRLSSPYLLWYLNYCCKDDYGSTLQDTSAYAGLHYFCARRAMASNAESSAVLTWPQGNSFLADKLYETSRERLRTNQLITSVNLVNNQVEVVSYNTVSGECVQYLCDQAILCTPQYVNARLLPESLLGRRQDTHLFEYSPWMVANITLTDLPQYKGEPLSWDNVLYHSKSLGYVNACHQHLNKESNGLVLTYYLPLTDLPAKEARKMARDKTYEGWKKEIISDLQIAHSHIEAYMTNIDIKIWGHGMIKPKPDFIFNPEKEAFSESIQHKLFFAHTDLSGISIFEEAFAQGLNAAKMIIDTYDASSKK